MRSSALSLFCLGFLAAACAKAPSPLADGARSGPREGDAAVSASYCEAFVKKLSAGGTLSSACVDALPEHCANEMAPRVSDAHKAAIVSCGGDDSACVARRRSGEPTKVQKKLAAAICSQCGRGELTNEHQLSCRHDARFGVAMETGPHGSKAVSPFGSTENILRASDSAAELALSRCIGGRNDDAADPYACDTRIGNCIGALVDRPPPAVCRR